MQIMEKHVPSSNGIHKLAGWVYLPEGKPLGILHIVHGMTEYIGRYDQFMRKMASAGYIVCGYDHLGHGQTVNDPSELGYIAKKRGWDLLLRDVKRFSDTIRTEYGADLPYILMGHSMGSFIARLAAERYVKPAILIIMGTGGPNPIAGAGLAVIGVIKTFKGDKHISPLVENLAFGSYNSRFGGKDADPKAWLTNDTAVRDRYSADPLCMFKFTVSAMGDLIRLTKYANRGAWFKSLPTDLPILLVSGEDDPVGDYGKGVLTVRDRLQKAGKNVTCRVYRQARHEILNDHCRDQVVADIQDFLSATISTEKETI